ncbi:MAG: hypothetical protein HQ592_01400 [Planctomycetes bacterium]|nr:hypothetical protein [Planctomycetota bacterium]
MAEIVAIGEKDQIIGFRGVGVRIAPVKNNEEFAGALKEASRDAEVEIILTPESFAEGENAALIRDARKNTMKVIIVIPDHHGSKGLALMEMKEDVERALGVDMISKSE